MASSRREAAPYEPTIDYFVNYIFAMVFGAAEITVLVHIGVTLASGDECPSSDGQSACAMLNDFCAVFSFGLGSRDFYAVKKRVSAA